MLLVWALARSGAAPALATKSLKKAALPGTLNA